MKRNPDTPTVKELTAWAKAADLYNRPGDESPAFYHHKPYVNIPGVGVRYIMRESSHLANMAWEPHSYASHASPLIEALRLSIMPFADGWVNQFDTGGSPTYAQSAIAAVRAKLKEGRP